jgi:prevent-host-death family protein
MRKAKPDSKTIERPEVGAKEAKGQLSALLSRVGFGNERIAITRNGKRIAALVSAADLDTLDAA